MEGLGTKHVAATEFVKQNLCSEFEYSTLLFFETLLRYI